MLLVLAMQSTFHRKYFPIEIADRAAGQLLRASRVAFLHHAEQE
jgi:hypothetical protein